MIDGTPTRTPRKKKVVRIDPPPPLLHTEPEAAGLLRLDVRHLKRQRLDGKIPFVQFGPRTYLYKPADISAWIERNRVDPTR